MQKQKMMTLVVGRSGRGKDYLTQQFAKQGCKILKSYSTREPRFEGEDTHIFIKPDEIDNYPNKVAETTIRNATYFATKEQVESNDFYIIDPKGIQELIKNMPDTLFDIIYVTADETECKTRAIARADDKEKETEIYEQRIKDEDTLFIEFEDNLENLSYFSDNVMAITTFINDYTPEKVEEFVESTLVRYKILHQLETIIDQLETNDFIKTEHGLVEVNYWNKKDPTKPLSKYMSATEFATIAWYHNATFISLMRDYMCMLANMDLKDENRNNPK